MRIASGEARIVKAIRFHQTELDAIEDARGDVTFSAWVVAAVRQRLALPANTLPSNGTAAKPPAAAQDWDTKGVNGENDLRPSASQPGTERSRGVAEPVAASQPGMPPAGVRAAVTSQGNGIGDDMRPYTDDVIPDDAGCPVCGSVSVGVHQRGCLYGT